MCCFARENLTRNAKFFSRPRQAKSNVKELDFESMIANEVASLLDVLAHQDTKQPVRLAGVIKFDVQQRAASRDSSSFPTIVRRSSRPGL